MDEVGVKHSNTVDSVHEEEDKTQSHNTFFILSLVLQILKSNKLITYSIN